MKSEDVDHIAHLARIALEPAERERITRQLDDILRYVGKLGELDTSGVEPMPYPIEIRDAFRSGRATPGLTREAALANAPKTEGLFFRVPRILEGGDACSSA